MPGPVCMAKTPIVLAGGDAADGVGHVDADALLADDDRADVGLGRRLDDRVDRVADQELDAFALQDLGNRGADFHVVTSCDGAGGWAGERIAARPRPAIGAHRAWAVT